MDTGEVIGSQDLLFNPFDPEFRINPYPKYERLRREDPIHFAPLGVWVLSRYAECHALLHHPRTSTDESNSELFQEFVKTNPEIAEFAELRANMRPFLFMDPPDHTRLRGLVSKAFTPRVVEGLKPRAIEIVDSLLDAAEKNRGMDVIEDLAYPLPVRIISEMLGVPPEDHDTFKGWSKVLARSLDPDIALPPEVLEARRKAAMEFADYFRGLIAKRRKNPTDDLLSGLIAAEDRGDTLTENELLSTCILILIAGHETTVNLIGNGILALLRNRDQFDLLRENPALGQTAVEEVLRYDPPVQMTGRTVMEDVQFGDFTIQKGQQSVILLASANRDPDQFENADRFDVTRTRNKHIAFSQGIHFCLGAPLARVEGQIALNAMVQRFPQMKLETDQPEYKENIVLRGLAALPVSV